MGDSASERQRLREQSRRLHLLTQRALRDAGVAPGMRVLELGTGLGDVTRLIAERVGAGGEIVSIERSLIMLARARRNFAAHGIANARVVECDLSHLRLDVELPFDALVGRLVLTHLADPAATLRQALEFVRPGGVVLFLEADFTLCDHLLALHRDRLPLTSQVCEWIKLARQGTAMDPLTGRGLYHVFRAAGLPAPTIQLHTELYGGNRAARAGNTATIVRNLLPRLERLKIGAADIGLETLEQRLEAEAEAADVVQALASIATAWTVKSG